MKVGSDMKIHEPWKVFIKVSQLAKMFSGGIGRNINTDKLIYSI
jgi:hypothetical protein